MGSMYSNNENIIRIMFQTLSYYGIYTSGKVIKKMVKLLKEDVLKFSIDFSHDIVQKDFELNRFEILKLSNTDRKNLIIINCIDMNIEKNQI